jgi:hypothetical protein
MKRIFNRLVSIIFCTILICIVAGLLSADSKENTIGVVLSLSGDLVLQSDGGEKTLAPRDLLSGTSIIALKKGAKTGKVQIGTIDGPIVFKKFPVKLGSANLKAIPDDLKDNYIASIGGTVLRGGHNKEIIGLFDWSIQNIGALDAKEIEKGLDIIVSSTKSSKENFSLNPIYFKLEPGVEIKSATCDVVEDTTGVRHGEGKWLSKDGELLFRIDPTKYEPGVDYSVRTQFKLKDGSDAQWSLGFTIFGNEDVSYVEDEIGKALSGKERDFEKKIIRAGKYQNYNFKLKALGILKDAGIEIDGML